MVGAEQVSSISACLWVLNSRTSSDCYFRKYSLYVHDILPSVSCTASSSSTLIPSRRSCWIYPLSAPRCSERHLPATPRSWWKAWPVQRWFSRCGVHNFFLLNPSRKAAFSCMCTCFHVSTCFKRSRGHGYVSRRMMQVTASKRGS